MYNFCTLFDSGYLDKGLALYRSLEALPDEIHLYIFAFDDKCYEVLTKMNLQHATIIGLGLFETSDMLKIKEERTRAEYCWTCTPISIEYVLDNFHVNMCTYIDADMLFFSSVKPVFDKMIEQKASILITPHRFTKQESKLEQLYGRYCVEFNTFKNDEYGRSALTWWKEKCLEWCFYKKSDGRLGDQKYLDGWTEKFDRVCEIDHWGVGLAPWNIKQCHLLCAEEKKVQFVHKSSRLSYELICYHFQNIKFISDNLVNINVGKSDISLKKEIYHRYLVMINNIRKELYENYAMEFTLKKICSTNPVVAFVQKYIMKFKIRAISDIISLDRL